MWRPRPSIRDLLAALFLALALLGAWREKWGLAALFGAFSLSSWLLRAPAAVLLLFCVGGLLAGLSERGLPGEPFPWSGVALFGISGLLLARGRARPGERSPWLHERLAGSLDGLVTPICRGLTTELDRPTRAIRSFTWPWQRRRRLAAELDRLGLTRHPFEGFWQGRLGGPTGACRAGVPAPRPPRA